MNQRDQHYARLRAKKAMIPEQGVNLVGVDSFEEPGQELYLIGHYDSVREAQSAKSNWEATHQETAHIYTPETR